MLVCKVLVNIVILTLYILFWLLCYVVCNKGINNIVILYTCWPAREYARIFSAIPSIHTSKNRHTGSNTRSTIKRSLKSIEPFSRHTNYIKDLHCCVAQCSLTLLDQVPNIKFSKRTQVQDVNKRILELKWSWAGRAIRRRDDRRSKVLTEWWPETAEGAKVVRRQDGSTTH